MEQVILAGDCRFIIIGTIGRPSGNEELRVDHRVQLSLGQRLIKKRTESLNFAPLRVAPDRLLLSLTFEDFPRSAWLESKPLLLEYQVQATFYASESFWLQRDGNVAFSTGDNLVDVVEHRHEIGCHTYYHERCIFHDAGRVRKLVERNTAALRETLKAYEPKTFAFPYIHTTLSSPRMLMRRLILPWHPLPMGHSGLGLFPSPGAWPRAALA